MNLKCLIGLHKWRYRYDDFFVEKECERCGKIDREEIPLEVMLARFNVNVLTALLLRFFRGEKEAEVFLRFWLNEGKALAQTNELRRVDAANTATYSWILSLLREVDEAST
jgi:hypothetical protein